MWEHCLEKEASIIQEICGQGQPANRPSLKEISPINNTLNSSRKESSLKLNSISARKEIILFFISLCTEHFN